MPDLLAKLESGHPAAARLLSPLGRRAALVLGVPQQAAEAARCERQASIGQITAGDGQPLTLPALAGRFVGLDPKQAFLYAPTAGLLPLRTAWRERLGSAPATLPVVTNGMSHGLSLVADLFASPEHPLLLATPYWDNYDTIWHMRAGAEMRTFPLFNEARGLDIEAMGARLAELRGPASLLLNFPNNPTGYSPTAAEADAIAACIHAHPHPLAVVCDDAYAGYYFDDSCYGSSLYTKLAVGADPERLLVCKVDGASKELLFFGGRVGFLTFSATGAAGDVLVEKASAILRGTISSVSAPAQSVVLAALREPNLAGQQDEVRGVLKRRYEALRTALAAAKVPALPFNSGCFALLPLGPEHDAQTVRRRLIEEQSTGVIAVTSENALRVAFCSIDEGDIPDLVERIARVVQN